jgi:hypothetical protein
MILSRDFREFVESLNANRVRYLVVGGYAVALHGYPRLTKDLDIWLGPDHENAARLLRALDDFGFGSLGLAETDFLEPDQIVQLGYPPNRIDLITSLPGVDFESCYPARVTITVAQSGETPVEFIGLECLRASKRAAGRLQDLADLENLE